MADGEGTHAQQERRPQTSTRDPAELRTRLQAWLARTLGTEAEPQITSFEPPSGNGMSSETVLFDASWLEAGGRRSHALVARMAPEPTAVPVFQTYDLDEQARVMQLVAQHSPVPVPTIYWSEPDPALLGAPFFIMQRVDGRVPADMTPYNFGSWLSEASRDEQARLQESTVRVLADLHAIPDPTRTFAFLDSRAPGATPLARHVGDWRAYYEWVTSDGLRIPLLERCLAWLESNWPPDEGPTVLSWGDARIGNVIYRDFTPAAVLDWEMAGLGPPELDVGWLIFFHQFFEDFARRLGVAGMPHFLRSDDVAAAYERMTGHTPRDLGFYTMYAGLRHGIIMSRIRRRAIHFGESEMPEDPDDLVLHRALLEDMLADTPGAG